MNESSNYVEEYRLNNVGDITDLSATSKPSEYMLITKEGLRLCNITSYSIALNKNEEYFNHKKVAGAFEYLPNIFIVALDKEQWLYKLDRSIKRSSNFVKNPTGNKQYCGL